MEQEYHRWPLQYALARRERLGCLAEMLALALAFQQIWFDHIVQLLDFIHQSLDLLDSRFLRWPLTTRLLRGGRDRWLHCEPQSAPTMNCWGRHSFCRYSSFNSRLMHEIGIARRGLKPSLHNQDTRCSLLRSVWSLLHVSNRINSRTFPQSADPCIFV